MPDQLLEVGELPGVSWVKTGRPRGRWRGHDHLAKELRELAYREPDPDKRWGKVSAREPDTKAPAIVSAIKKGEAIGFEGTIDGYFEAKSRKSADQSRAPIHPKTQRPRILYDIWARYVPNS